MASLCGILTWDGAKRQSIVKKPEEGGEDSCSKLGACRRYGDKGGKSESVVF